MGQTFGQLPSLQNTCRATAQVGEFVVFCPGTVLTSVGGDFLEVAGFDVPAVG